MCFILGYMSLTKTDLMAIEKIVEKTVKKTVDPRFDKLEEGIDALAMSTAAGFNEMDERFQDVYRRFDEVDERFNQVDERFDRIEGRLITVEKDTSRLRGNFLGLRSKVVDKNL